MVNTRIAFIAALLLGVVSVSLAQTEAELIAVLKKPGATLKEKADACRLLQRTGTKVAVPVLAPLLADEKLSHMARYALESIPDPAVDSAFRAALATVKGRQLVGVISSIGVRRDAGAVEPLIVLLRNSDLEVAHAAARTLGSVGNSTAFRALDDAWTYVSLENRLAVAEGLLRCAETMVIANQLTSAWPIYVRLRLPDAPHQLRTAGQRGSVMTNRDRSSALLGELLRGNDIGTTSGAVRTAMDMPPGWVVTEALTQAVGQAVGDRKILIIQAIGKTADPSTLPVLLAAAKTQDKSVQIAAVKAMGEVGSPAAVSVLTGFLGDAEVGPAARESLASLEGAEADAAVLKLFNDPAKAQRVTGMALVARRRMIPQIPQVLKAASDADAEVRAAAFHAAGELAGAAQLPALLDLLGAASGADLDAAGKAVAAVVSKMRDSDATAQIQARLAKMQPAQKAALLRILGAIGGPQALAAVRASLVDADKPVREAAIATLGGWKTIDAGPVLLESAQKTADPAERLLSLRTFFALAARGSDKEPQSRVDLCQQAVRVALRPEEKKLLFTALGAIPSPSSAGALQSYLDDAATRGDAAAAVLKVSERLISSRRTPPAELRQLVEPLQKVAQVAGGPAAQQAAALLKQAQAGS